VQMRVTAGGFFGGDRLALTPTIKFRAGDALTTEFNYQRNEVYLPGGAFVTNLIRTRVSYSFSSRVFTQALVQYNDRADLWSMNFRFGWLQAAESYRESERPNSLNQATAACSWYFASNSAGGTSPIGPSSRRILNQSTQSSVANSTASSDRHGPRRRITSVLYSPITDSARALS